MGWRGRGRSTWPGRGPFSYLPPWERPGWVYGRGACWRFFAPYLQTAMPTIAETASGSPTIPVIPFESTMSKEQEATMLERQIGFFQTQLDAIKKRLEELKT